MSAAPNDAAATPDGKKPNPLKSTLNLPVTAFAMKANLPVNEPLRLDQWAQNDLYAQIRASRAGKPKYILHDGPPYANGAIHLGHALNKCIKDFVVKSKTMAGFDAPYVPGWDCHGLPIEIKVDEQLGRKKLEMEPIAVRRACREYAQKYLDIQREQFIRLGVFGRWANPYSTMSFEYEAAIAETFFDFFEKGFVYKGLRPVYWCVNDKTALAEAEVEYEQHTSPTIYVRYALKSDPASISPALAGKTVYTIIWTTTPWTTPASMAVAFNPEFDYVALENTDGNIYIVAEALAEATKAGCNLPDAKPIATFKGAALDTKIFRHPFLDRDVLGVLADYVTAEQGTGAVHTAPAHGVDDFATGKRYGIETKFYVDNAGRQMHTGGEPYEGLNVFKSNPVIVELLKEKGALLGYAEITHSYPHCWRCHKPVIVRATEQWFIGMETPMAAADGTSTTFRQRALSEIDKVVWDPSWGKERISNMIATRPDWCISRQRIWGVPIAVFLCEKCHTPLNDPAINRSIVERFKKEGADAWYIHEAAALLPAGTKCTCGHAEFRKEMDIVDVWFESGASWHAVLDVEPELHWPADLYTEGGDQHRGWFHSSLLCSVGVRDAAPYKMVATSGWTLDEQGRAMSKSLGNVVDPVDIAKRLGAEIVRLWVASVDFREDVAASENLMQRVSDNYRKLRNTFRFLLGSIGDFDPAKHEVKFADMQPLDQYMLARTAEVTKKIRASYEAFEFHRVYHALNEFCNTELSALYLDVLKDRLYTFAPNSPARRSAQTAIWQIAEALVKLVAPILSFTAEEVWQQLPKIEGREASVHMAEFPNLNIAPETAKKIEEDWNFLLIVRDQILMELESLRADKTIGKSLEAIVSLNVDKSPLPSTPLQLQQYETTLAELFNVSEVELVKVPRDNAPTLKQVSARRSDKPKCDRCWRYTSDVGSDSKYPTVCARCAEALTEIGFAPYTATTEAE
jgi:isoleucyl-tRNA synthetase